MATADRISRKAIRQPDEFQELTVRATTWLRENQSAVIGATSAIAIVLAAIAVVNWNSSRQNAAAAIRFDAARQALEASNYTGAATDFESLAQDAPRTPAGRLAMLYRGHALSRQPDPAGAAAAYTEYLAASPATDYLRQEALLGLARAKEAQSDAAGALDAYRQAADAAGPFRTAARLGQARLMEASGDAAGAKALYTELHQAVDLDPATRMFLATKVPPPAAPSDTAPQAE